MKSFLAELCAHPYLAFTLAFLGTVGFGLVRLASILPNH